MKYDSTGAFHWNTPLSTARQEAIVAWIKSLPEDNQIMIEDMIEDTQLEERFNAAENADI